MPFYGVRKGRSTGVFGDWPSCQAQVENFKGARYKKFATLEEANAFVNGCDELAGQDGTAGQLESEDDWPKIYIDGACSKNGYNGARAGLGVYFGRGDWRNLSERVRGRQTNNSAEIQAATRAIEQAKACGLRRVQLMTDSQFLKNTVELWLDRWKANGFRTQAGQPVKNEDDVRELDEALRFMQVKFHYVKAHCGIVGNERADQLAVAGAQLA